MKHDQADEVQCLPHAVRLIKVYRTMAAIEVLPCRWAAGFEHLHK